MKWEVKKLGEIAEFKNGINYSKDNFGKGIKVVNVSDFQSNFSLDYNKLQEIDPDGLVKESDLLKSNDVLFVRSNGNKSLVGRSVFLSNVIEPITFSGFSIRCRFNERNAFPKFYAYLFKGEIIRNVLSNSSVGTNITNLNQGLLNNLSIVCPPLPIQKKIASILSAYDDLIENNTKRIKLLEEAAQNIYKEWFVHFRFPDYEKAKFENGLPKGWRKVNLYEVYSINYGKNLPVIKIADVSKYPVYGASGIIGFYEEKNVSEKVALITSRGNGSGDVSRTKEEEVFVTNNSFTVIPNNDYRHIPYFFTVELLKTLNLKSYCSGSAQPQLTNASMNNIQVTLPTQLLIEKYKCTCKEMLDMSDSLSYQNKVLSQARDILLPRLMNGEIEVDATIHELEEA